MDNSYKTLPPGISDRGLQNLARLGSERFAASDSVCKSEALEGFRKAQLLAYECVTDVGARLAPGMSEKQAAQMLEDYLKAVGCERFIHRPFAWFGDHSRFDGYRGFGDFHPGERRLTIDAPVILDVSPVVEGYTADVGYSMCLQENSELEDAMDFLGELRNQLPGLFESDLTAQDIWHTVHQQVTEAGFDNIHALYPLSVLGHRVFKLRERGRKARRVPLGAFGWFSLETNLNFLKAGVGAALTPDNLGPKTGLWAIEPHIGWPGGGAKFEEILVVDAQGARWLSDDVPHATRTCFLFEGSS